MDDEGPICEECGNDLATEGYRYCTDCLEALTESGELDMNEATLPKTCKSHVEHRQTYAVMYAVEGVEREKPFSTSGQRYRVTRVRVKCEWVPETGWRLEELTLQGPVLKKDGSDGVNVGSEVFRAWWSRDPLEGWPEWVRELARTTLEEAP